MRYSTKWKIWKAILDLKTCLNCRKNNGKIYDINEKVDPEPPLHPKCRCVIERLKSIYAGTATKNGVTGAERIVFSNDGLIFITYDHYRTFIEVE